MREVSKKHLAIIKRAQKTAERWGDSSVRAREMRLVANVWECGLCEVVPSYLRVIEKQLEIEADPEWQEYQRLKARFEE